MSRLFGYGLSLTNDRDQAGDLVQECALKALSALRVPTDEAAYRAWLFRIQRNTFLDRQRRKGRQGQAVEITDEVALDGDIWHSDDRLISAITVRLAWPSCPARTGRSWRSSTWSDSAMPRPPSC